MNVSNLKAESGDDYKNISVRQRCQHIANIANYIVKLNDCAEI